MATKQQGFLDRLLRYLSRRRFYERCG